MAQANGDGNGHSPKPRRRRNTEHELRVVEPDPEEAADPSETVYDSRSFLEFFRRFTQADSDVHSAQADLREIWKAEIDRGLRKRSSKIAISLHKAIENETISAAEAYEILDEARTMLDWLGHEIAAKDLVSRMQAEEGTSPPV